MIRSTTRAVCFLICRSDVAQTFGILGNHDYGMSWSQTNVADELTALAQSVGVQMLRNETREVDGLQIVGLDDLWSGLFDVQKALTQADLSRPAIALTHNPDTVDEPGWEGYTGWILAGHTHGGQCKPPFLPPPMLPVKNRRYTSGEFELSGGPAHVHQPRRRTSATSPFQRAAGGYAVFSSRERKPVDDR